MSFLPVHLHQFFFNHSSAHYTPASSMQCSLPKSQSCVLSYCNVYIPIVGSSLEGQRTVTDFFYMLDHFINVIGAEDYRLKQLDDECHLLGSV